MTKTIYVTRAQQLAAQSIVARSARSGKPVRSSITKIAAAADRTSPESDVTQSSPATTI